MNRIVKAYRDERRIKDATRKPRSRATTNQKDREIVAYVVDKPSASVQEIRANLGIQSSKTTVKRRIAEAGLSSCTAVKKPLLRNDNKNKRLLFAQEHRDWTVEKWKLVVFTDESTFTTDCHQQQKVGDLEMLGKNFLAVKSC